MVRIDKLVVVLLKQGLPFELLKDNLTDSFYVNFDYMGGDWGPDPAYEAWVEDVLASVLTDPTVDEIIQDYGLTLPDIWGDEGVEFRFYLEVPGSENTGISGTYGYGLIDIVLPYDYYSHNEPAELRGILLHEIVHYLDDRGGGIAIPSPYQDWMTSPDEQEAMAAQVEVLLNEGYSDQEVIGLMMEELGYWRRDSDRVEFAEILQDLIDTVRAEGLVV